MKLQSAMLVNCPTCGNTVSPNADACPHCGELGFNSQRSLPPVKPGVLVGCLIAIALPVSLLVAFCLLEMITEGLLQNGG